MTGRKGRKGGRRRRLRVRDFPRRQRLAGVPPADSEIWPEAFRGERWKPVYGILFAGKCQLCAYSCELPKSRQILDQLHRQSRLVLCVNHVNHPGELLEVLPTQTCRNFKAKAWQPARAERTEAAPNPAAEAVDDSVRRVPVGKGMFAIVDAADYERVSRYRWHTIRHGSKFYACCHVGRKLVSMHRMIVKPRKGYVVDHIDGNGLNNRRGNLRECTVQQNRANARSRGGSSRFVGVYRRGKKWVAGIQYRGKYHYLGLFDNETEAARARDRKARELLGEYAYLNFPEDFPPAVSRPSIEGA
jgi:hypothetical protein